MEIQVDYETFEAAHMLLEDSYRSLAAIEVKLDAVQSKSQTMKAFQKRVKKMSKLVKEYEGLLGEDLLALYKAVTEFAEVDEDIAAGYKEGLAKARNMKPSAEGGVANGPGSGGGVGPR